LYGSAYDPWTDGGPYLWLFSQDGGSVLHQFDIATQTFTGVIHNAADIPGFNDGIAGGAATYINDDAIFVLLVNVQQDPNLVAGYELALTSDPNAPGAPTDFVITPGAAGALEATLDWVNPSVNSVGDPLTELTSVEVYRNDDLVYTVTNPVIGGPETWTDTTVPDPGMYTYKIIPVNSYGNGLPAVDQAWIGEDVPAAVENLLAEDVSTDDFAVLLTWDNPTEGLHGGYFTGVTGYHIVRNDGAEFDIAGPVTEWTDDTVPVAGTYQYDVTTVNDIGMGGTETSNPVVVGDFLILENFDTFPPAGWYREGVNGGMNWRGVNTNNAGGTAPEAEFYWSPSTIGEQKLVTPQLNTVGMASLALEFKTYINHFSNSYTVGVKTTSDGTNWNDAWTIVVSSSIPAHTEDVLITTPDVGSATFQMCFFFNGDSWDINWWDIDDVSLAEGPSIEYGNISGTVTLNGGSGNVENVEVEAGGIVVNPDASGYYIIEDLLVGLYDVTASLTGYIPQTIENVEVLANQTTENIDFVLDPSEFIEFIYDDGSAEWGWWVQGPAGPSDYFSERITVEEGVLPAPYSAEKIKIYWYDHGNYSPTNMDIMLCPAVGGVPDLNNPYFTESFPVTQDQLDTWVEYELGTDGIQIPENGDIFIVVHWTPGAQNGPWVGSDQNGPMFNRSCWSLDGVSWNPLSGDNFMMRLLAAPGGPPPIGWITGNVELVGGAGNVEDVEVTAGDVTVNPDANGDYIIEINEGTYDVTASLENYEPQTITGVEVIEGQTTENIDFTLNYIPQPGWIEGTVTLTGGSGNVEDVEVTANGTTVNPDASGYYIIPDLEPGLYTVSASLENYPTVTYEDVEVLEGQGTTVDFELISNAPAWFLMPGTQYSMVVMATIDLDLTDEEFTGEGGNMAVAFGPEFIANPDTLVVRSFGLWQVLPTGGFWYFTIVGNEDPGQIMIGFKIYDATTQEVYLCNESVGFENNATIGSPTDPFILTAPAGGVEEQTISLIENWNWISTYVHPEDTSIEAVFGVLGDAVHQVKSQTQSKIYENGVWIGDLMNIVDGESYVVQMNSAADLTISGTLIDYTVPIPLDAEWNWLGYVLKDPYDFQVALAGILDNMSQIKNQTQASIKWGSNWYGTLTTMEAGVGYKVFMDQADELVYQTGTKVASVEPVPTNAMNWKPMAGTQYNMVVIANINADPTSLVAAFDNENNCRSVGKWEDGFWYFTIVGNENGEAISFKMYDGDIYESAETITFSNDETLGTPDNPITITMSTGANTPTTYNLSQNYPNPFNPVTVIAYQLPTASNVEISIYNIKGEKIRTLVNENREAGMYKVTWNGKDNNNNAVSSGIYFYRIITNNYSDTKKMILMK